jgi:hypothetical protein
MKYQFTIGRAMIVIAACALILATTRSAPLAVIALLGFAVIALLGIAAYYVLYRGMLRGPRLTTFQATVAWVAIVIAMLAITLATTRSALAAVAMVSLIASYYAFDRYVLSGPPLPQRHRTTKPAFPGEDAVKADATYRSGPSTATTGFPNGT